MTATPLDLERACLRAWPGAVRAERFGWVMQAARGRSHRANAVWPLAWTGEAPLDDAIAQSAGWCRAQGIAPCFKLADGATFPAVLPQALSAAGYAPHAETLVMTRHLDELASASQRVALLDEPTENIWAPLRDSAPSPEDYAERRDIVERIAEPHLFALAQSDRSDAAIGLGVLSDDLIGLYLMRTAPWARRRGLARDIVRTLCAAGALSGAHTAYLQVEADNGAAAALYAGEGFSVAYRYRYWR